jgi:predicted outer membrane protein
MMKKLQNYRLIFLAITFLVAILSCSNGKTEDSKEIAETVNDKKLRSKAAETDAQFLVNATATCYDINRMADIALTNGTGQPIKKLAKLIKDSNARLIDQCNNVAGRKAITLPTEGTEKTLQVAGAMVDKAGKDFNQQWFDKTGKLYTKQLQTFEVASGHATDSTIRDWFIQNLPAIQQQNATLDSVAGIVVQ